MKKFIAFLLVAALILPIFAACGRGNNANTVVVPPIIEAGDTTVASRSFGIQQLVAENPTAEHLSFADHTFSEELLVPRDGYVLVPTMYSAAGIDTLSSFFLRTPYAIPADAPTPPISIDNQPPPSITREGTNTFLVTPAVPLTPNSVYVVRFVREVSQDITWAFQTATRFEITTTLPRHQSTNVPVRTGIEINFSIEGETNIADYFSIYPHAEGRFIRRGNTSIFMPTSPLEYLQVYTVTVRAGVTLEGIDKKTTTDRVFSFETAPSSAHADREWTPRVHFSRLHVEFPSFAPPSVSFWFNYDRGRGVARPVINVGVYRIDDRADAIAAVNRLANTPNWIWAHNTVKDRLIDVSDLTRVYSSRITDRHEVNWNEVFTLSTTLPPGYYVLNAVVEGSNSQVIIQITDLAVQVIADDNMALVWVNDMTTGLPAAAKVYDPIDDTTYETSAYGIAVVERGMSAGEYVIVTADNGMENVVFIQPSAFQSFHQWGGWWSWPVAEASWDMGWSPSPWFWSTDANSNYWTALQLDRTLFQRNDTMSLWGFVQNRHQEENITHVTAIITEHAWWHSPERDTLHRQNIPVQYGSYSGEIRLPHLDPGFYELAIYHGDNALSSIFFSVQDYAKPPYRLTVSADKAAAFIGEEITFTARTEFFEGTPVPDLQLSYWMWGHNLRTPGGGSATTDINGFVERTIRLAPMDAAAQGIFHLQFSAEATLPEIGWVHETASARVFINDIHVRPKATRTEGNASLSIDVRNITIDRLNDGTAKHGGDFLCDPVAGQELQVEIFRVYWERIRDGERYDFITRQVVPRYRYERREQRLQQFTLTTDENGEASKDFTVPNRKNESYEARITTTDGNGRAIRHNAFIGRDWSSFFWNAGEDMPFLYGARPLNEGYDIGDEVELTIMSGTEPVTRGNFLFVVVQDGIMSYHIGENTLSFTFDEKHVPNTTVFAYHFNGHTYHTSGQMSQRLRFNSSTRNMVLTVETCRESYKPGDMSTITVTATDLEGNPKIANVNISLVDEALFALMDYSVDTLAMLYGMVNDRLTFSMATHSTFISDGIEEAELFGGWAADMAVPSPGVPAVAAEAAMDDGGGGGAQATIRERFEDTAVFKSLRTNEEGVATFTFQLPDNITSWRVTTSGISTSLYAGNDVQNIRVTNPMFLHYTLNSTFLVGDVPYIGVNAFGTSLTGGEQVTFEVWCEANPEDILTATGTAFERVNIRLWEMTEEGLHALVVRATVSGYSDAVRHTYQVVNSHREVDTAVFYEVTTNTVFATNPRGLTDITFTDRGRGQFLWNLMSMRWIRGARVEGLIARREATKLIERHFPDARLFGEKGDFDVREYQVESGGIAMLPYADANLQTTVMIMPFILDEINVHALRGYLYEIYQGGSQENKMLALYGLAMLGEPVLLSLRNYVMVEDLPVQNVAYVALGLAALGETQTARNLFTTRIVPHIQAIAPYYRVNVGTSRADILDTTSAAALLAAQLGMPQALGLHNYVARNRTDNLVLTLERLAFISHQIENFNEMPASITYTLFGEEFTRDLSGGKQFTLRIPAENMSEFNLVSITGDVGAVSIIRTPLEEVEPIDNDIQIRREFFRAGTDTRATTFRQDEIIRVQITINYSAQDISGSYVITDFLPAGLTVVENSARFGSRNNLSRHWTHVTTEGQRVTFFDFNGRFRHNVYYYYARVINPGVFRAEGTMVQSIGAREYLTVGECAVLTIQD
ncbi:MAG: Ig-like domain-containing protein [Firmicutes bacterium]|nr:Ig-like domain-containing protein [Bacillota bacterium]